MEVTTFDLITVGAIVAGPIFAILVSRWLDDTRDVRSRRMDIFRTLMRTRRTPIVADHVGALNLIEIEFAEKAEVIAAWKKLMEHLGTEHPRKPEEDDRKATDAQDQINRNEKYYDRLYGERQSLLAKLLHAIALDLGHKAEQLELFEGGYTPQGWHDVEMEQRIIRRFVVDLYHGNRVVPVGVLDYRTFTAPPDAGDAGTDGNENNSAG